METEYYFMILLDMIRYRQKKYLEIFNNNKKLLLNVRKIMKYFIQDHKQNTLKSF